MAESAAGAIYDIGYQHYDGKRLGRRGAVRALYVHGLRTVFGLGRGGRAKIPPIALIIFLIVPAVIQAALAGLGNGMIQLFTHEGYFRTTIWVFALFCAFQTPELVTGDLQHRVLALYFSRALRRSDYVLARLGSLATALFMVALLPHLLLLLGQWFSAADVRAAMRDSLPLLPRIVGASLAIAVLLATVSLTIAAVIRRRPFATAAILTVFLLATAFVTPLVLTRPEKMRYLVLASPLMVGDGVTTWIFTTSAARAAADSVARERALADSIARANPPPVAGNARGRQRSNMRRFRDGRTTVLDVASLPGVLFGFATLCYLALSAGVLTLRYRSVDT